MSLVTGRGPLSSNPAGRFVPQIPARVVYIEPHPRRIQAYRDGRVVIDTEQALLVHSPDRTLRYAFPADAVAELPNEPEAEAPGYAYVPWGAVDAWFEEGRKLVNYPPNPYHRVDCRPTKRHLTVKVGQTILVDTDDTTIVFETALPPRLYVAPEHVRTDLLHQTGTTSYCNYKGYATYWAADDKDVAWTYEDPLPETQPIKGYFSFEGAHAEVEAELPEP